jgi:glyoxylase-like metal-dependent hydrolase (beta-lactamase superfamily II)
MDEIKQGNFRLIKVGPLGPFANNAYIIADEESREALLVDMPSQSEQTLHVISERGYNVKAILLTHAHGDHWADYGLVKNALDVPVMAHPAERPVLGDRIDEPLAHGQELSVGPFVINAMHTPGHTPGSTCFVTGKHLISGDTLFPGGPGRSNSPEDLQEMISSITSMLFELPDPTDVLPGHGDNGRIGDSKREYAVFEGREHPVDLYGDVTWEGS